MKQDYAALQYLLKVLSFEGSLVILDKMRDGEEHRFYNLQKLGLTSSTVSKTLGWLRCAGLVERTYAEYHKYPERYQLTALGKDVVDGIDSVMEIYNLRLLDDDALLKSLDTLPKSLKKGGDFPYEALPQNNIILDPNQMIRLVIKGDVAHWKGKKKDYYIKKKEKKKA